MKKITLELTKPEALHILHLIHKNSEDGEYYGNERQYWERSLRILAKFPPKEERG
jgi:hypothetical protein